MSIGPDQADVEVAISRVLAAARQPGNRHDLARLGPVSLWLQREARAAGLDLAGFEHVVDTSAVRHIRKNHSDPEKERARGQLPVTDADLLSIPRIVADPDALIFGTANRLGHQQIVYLKKLVDGSTLYLEEARVGKKQVAAQSMRKYPPTMSVAAIAATLDPNVRSDRKAGLKIIDAPSGGKEAASARSTEPGDAIVAAGPVDLHTPLLAVAKSWLPRILTQICRDPTSPLYGCADRNWWHYKIRDFPSIILQQAGYACQLAALHPDWAEDAEQLEQIAAGSARFWNVRAKKHHAFEEYYPWEQGYPPLAFSTLAAAKLAAPFMDGTPQPFHATAEELRPGLVRAARQLRTRFEDKAANQQVAGLAALAWVDRILPDQADPAALARQKERTLALQHEEGWYWEYDGPDLGYLAVTIDCLWDLHDATDDEDYLASAGRALAYMAEFVAAAPDGVGLHNSRNTDYLVPYGIMRSAIWGDVNQRRDAQAIAGWAFAGADRSNHFFAAVDDRYICHYVGHSVLRALLVLNGPPPSPPSEALAKRPPRLLVGSGHYLEDNLIVSCRKGGIVTLTGGHGEASDFGWIVERGKTQFVTHWWSPDWTFREQDGAVTVEGAFFPHTEKVSTPLKHIVLRCLSFVLGRRLIGLLKRVLIFKRGGKADLTFARTIRRAGTTVEIVDRIAGLTDSDRLLRAPRPSKRHVASADSFHRQDLGLVGPRDMEETRAHDGDVLTITTHLTPP